MARLSPWASQVANFIEKSPELVHPQLKELATSLIGDRTPKILRMIGWSLRTSLRRSRFHLLSVVIKSPTFSFGQGMEVAGHWSIAYRHLVSNQLSNQNETVQLLSIFQINPSISRSLLRVTLFQTGESIGFIL